MSGGYVYKDVYIYIYIYVRIYIYIYIDEATYLESQISQDVGYIDI